MKRKPLFRWFLLTFLLVLTFAWMQFFRPNTGGFAERKFLYVHTGDDFQHLLQQMKDSNLLARTASFERVAMWLNLPSNLHPGRYEVKEGMGNYAIISMLKSGRQKPVRLVINKLRTKQDIIRKLALNLEADSPELARYLNDPAFMNKWQLDTNQVQCLFVPATYELYWNTSAEKAIEKIAQSHEQFWNEERKAKAAQLKLSIPQVVAIASIVEEETNQDEEKAKIAGVYLNRYRIGMKLGADPTVKFAVGDFALRRILNIHTQFPSPYNTYLNAGIPPGPICTPSPKSIEAVLQPDTSANLFFCAKEDFSGFHNFARTYSDHLANAKRYQEALNKRGIR